MESKINDFLLNHLKGEANPEQLDVFKWIIQGQDNFMFQPDKTLIVFGEAGTGKSELIRYLQHVLPTVITVCPSSKAAINVRGVTAHSFFMLPREVTTKESLSKLYHGKKTDVNSHNKALLRAASLLIIDEVSMLKYDDLWGMDFRCKAILKNDLPFGGLQVLFLGDVLQLPPVMSKEDKLAYSAIYGRKKWFFELLPYTNVIQLKKQYRQANSLEFAQLLGRVRIGKPTKEDLKLINTRIAKQPKGVVVLAHSNKTVDSYNMQQLAQLEGEKVAFRAEFKDLFTLKNAQLKDVLELKEGAQVISMVNDEKHQFLNGSTGIVKQLSDNYIAVEFGGELIKVKKVKVEQVGYRITKVKNDKRIESFVAGSMVQYPLKLGWAMTIHKAQGQTLDKVHINAPSYRFAYDALLYVALSRVSALEDLTLDHAIKAKDIQANPKALKWLAEFNNEHSKEI